MSDPRIAFLYTDAFVLAPTSHGLFSELRRHDSATFQCLDVSTTPVEAVVDLLRRVDLVVLDSLAIQGRTWSGGPNWWLDYGTNPSANAIADLIGVVLDSDVPLYLLAGEYDLHSGLPGGLTLEELRRFSVIAWTHVDEPVTFREVQERDYVDDWMEGLPEQVETWTSVVSTIPVQVEYAHSVQPEEIVGPLSRRWQTAVVGREYATRRVALGSARSSGLTVAPYRETDAALFNASRAARAMLPASRAPMVVRRAARLRYANMRTMVRHSATSFACGSGLRYMVRKYFEIPAMGSALVAYPALGMERYGFRDGVNFAATSPEEFGDVAAAVLSKPGEARRLAANAFALVSERHTTTVRARDLLRSFQLAARGELLGARYMDGTLEFDVRSGL